MNVFVILQVAILAVGGIGSALVIVGTVIKWRETRKQKDGEASV